MTRPWVAGVMFAAGVYGLVLPGVFTPAVSEHSAHVVTTGSFLFSGALLFAATAVAPFGRRRFGVLVFAWSQIGVAGIVVVNKQSVLREGYYASLKLAWHANLLDDQRLGVR